MDSKRFKKQDRLLKRAEYVGLSEKGRKVSNQYFVLIYSTNKNTHSRLGITVTKKIGKAATRNRIKRYCREFFRLNRCIIPENRDFNIIAKKYVTSLDLKQFFQTLGNIFKKIDQNENHKRID